VTVDEMQRDSILMEKHTLDTHGVLRYDFLFSYWMFMWFVLFWFLPKNDTLRTLIHPAFALVVGVFENLITVVLICIYNPKWQILWKFVAMMICIKLVPLYLVMYQTTPQPVPWGKSALAFVCVFSVYLGYLSIYGASFVDIYKTAILSVVHDKNKTPLFSVLRNITMFQ